MASLFHTPSFRVALRRVVPAKAARNGLALRETAPAAISVVQLWRESLQVFSAHGGVILLCILFGLSSPFLAGCWIATQAVLQDMAWVGPVPTLQEKVPPATLVALGIAGWLMTSFTRGLITGLALQPGAGCAIRGAWVRLPALLVSSLVYSALVAGCLLAFSPITRWDTDFSQTKSVPTWLGWTSAMDDISQQVAGKSLPAALPDAAPLSQLVIAAREVMLKSASRGEYERWLSESNGHSTVSSGDAGTHETLVIASAGALLLIVAETLLRFRIVLAFKPLERITTSNRKQGGYPFQRFAALSPLKDSVRFGWRNFSIIMLHVWLLRLAGAALVLLLVEWPIAASTHVVLPALISMTGKTPLLPALHFVQSSIAVCVAALVLAFSTIYDARLFMVLRRTND